MTDVHDEIDKIATEHEGGLLVDGKFVAQRTRYVWLDADGKRMGPIHAGLGEALNFLKRYPAAWEKLTNQLERRILDAGDEPRSYSVEQIRRALDALEKVSLTGKAPQTLRRIVAVTTVDAISEAEGTIIDEILNEVGDLRPTAEFVRSGNEWMEAARG